MDIEDNLNQHERDIGRIEGKLESLATKEFVRKEVSDAVRILDAKIDAKIDKQTEDIADKFQKLSDKIENERRWRMKDTGAASILALIFVAVSTLITTLVSLGVITPYSLFPAQFAKVSRIATPDKPRELATQSRD